MKELTVCVVLLLVGGMRGDDCAPWTQPLAQRRGKGAARLLGLADVHEGDRCHLLRPGGVEQLMLTIADMENQLMAYDLSEVEFELYDTCSNKSVAMSNLMRVLSRYENPENDCYTKSYLGVIGPENSSIQEEIQNFLSIINVPYYPLKLSSLKVEIEAIVKVLLDLNWKSVAVFSSSKALEDEFREEADRNNICITWTGVFPSNTFPSQESLSTLPSRVGIVLGPSPDLTLLSSSVQFLLSAGQRLPLTAVGGAPAVLFRRVPAAPPPVDSGLLRLYRFGERLQRLDLAASFVDYAGGCEGGCREWMRTPMAEGVREAVRRMAGDVNRAVHDFENTTKEVWIISQNETRNETSQDIEIWTFQNAIGKFSEPKEVQVGHYSDGNLVWDKKRLDIFHFTGSGWYKIPEFHCHLNCREVCTNFANISLEGGGGAEGLFARLSLWKHEPWVTALLTLSGVGALGALSAAAYLVRPSAAVRSRATGLAVLAAVVLAYACAATFGFEAVACSRRIAAVGVAHAAMLAPVLSRCFVVFAAEMDGIHGHVSGFLQAVLSLFVFGVQLAMAAYYWVLMGKETRRYRCVVKLKPTMAYLSYPLLLCITWLVISPFCLRMRRGDPREGLLLHLGSLATCGVWAVWLSLFFALPPRWAEFSMCLGLVGSATALLLVMFLPRVHRAIAASATRGQQREPVMSTSSNLSIYESINHGYNPDKDVYVVDAYREEEEESPGLRSMTHL